MPSRLHVRLLQTLAQARNTATPNQGEEQRMRHAVRDLPFSARPNATCTRGHARRRAHRFTATITGWFKERKTAEIERSPRASCGSGTTTPVGGGRRVQSPSNHICQHGHIAANTA